MAKAPKMVIVALVLSLLALPAFGVRQQGLEGISFSSQPLNGLDHHPAGLIEVEAGTGGKETQKEDQCAKQLFSLEKTFAKTCERHETEANKWQCPTMARNTIKGKKVYEWQDHLASKVLDAGKTPVFWAGFWPGGKKGLDARQALENFISSPSIKGFQLADTEWGQAAESKGADNLAACTWDRKKDWWFAASKKMAQAMALHNVPKIIIALHKNNVGNNDRKLYNSLLYQAELINMGLEMRNKPTWKPEFEVYSLKVTGSAAGCRMAKPIKESLELHADREVKVWCRLCSWGLTPSTCSNEKEEVKTRENIQGKCIKGDCQNGWGKKAWPNGDMYEGSWKNGLQEDEGTYTWSGGKMMYDGTYENGLQNGWGIFTYTNGDQYEGNFEEDEMDGKGILTLAKGGKKYKVVYEEGQLKKKVPLKRR